MPTQLRLQRSRARRELRARYRVEHAPNHPAGTEIAATARTTVSRARALRR